MDTLFQLESLEEFNNISKELLHSLYDSTQTSSDVTLPSMITRAKEELKGLIYDSDYDLTKVMELLRNRGWDTEKLDSFLSLLNEKRIDLLYTAIVHYNSNYDETVNEFDWILKLVLGTSELQMFKYTVLQLVVSTVEKSERKLREFDIPKDTLRRIIKALENV